MKILQTGFVVLCAVIAASGAGLEIAKRRPFPRVMKDIDDIKAGMTSMDQQLKDKIQAASRSHAQSCPTPPFLSGAEVTFSSTTPGSIATYKCKSGFKNIGGSQNTATCETNRMWTLSLVDVSCTDLTNCFVRKSDGKVMYRGTMSKTVSGRTCQRWAMNKPHKHGFHDKYDMTGWGEKNTADAVNYCRDPKKEKKLWCYTTDKKKRWEYCPTPAACRTTPYWTN